MRNEGPFIVEWVAWYRMLGFDVVIATNDCTDHSPYLLDALQDAGWLTHLRHTPAPGTPPKISAHATLQRHPGVRKADWVLVCDVDEFLVLHHTKTVQDYLTTLPYPFLGVAINWKVFGIGGWQRYRHGLTHRQFKRAGNSGLKVNRPFKSLYRAPATFGRMGAHTPHLFRGDWTAPENRWINSAGQTLPQFADPAAHPIRMLQQHDITHDAAQMNHYILRSAEHYAAKHGTLSASANVNRYTDEFYTRYNRNGVLDDSALRFETRFDKVFATAMALPDVARLHHLSGADYVARLCGHQGISPKDDPRWQSHMAAAG